MRKLLLLGTIIASPALAMQDPKPVKGGDPHVCDVIHNPNEVTNVTTVMGQEVTVRFSDNDHIQKVTTSDSAHMKFAVLPNERGNFVSMKGTQEMAAQPVFIVATRDDGSQRYYTLQWTALSDALSEKPVNVAANGDVVVVPPKPPATCYTIRYQYPGEVSAAQAAAWQAATARRRAIQQEIALHATTAISRRNVAYIGQGDQNLAPSDVFDDGYTTQITFGPGRRVPALLTVNPDGKESEITGITTLDNGALQIHGVLPLIRLREGDLVLCVINQGYSVNPSTDPQTGTTSPSIQREPYVKP